MKKIQETSRPAPSLRRKPDDINMTDQARTLLDSSIKITKEDFYPMRKYNPETRRWMDRMVPGARVINVMAQENRIKHKILDLGKDTEKAWCRVAAWTGREDDPIHYVEDEVIHVFSSIRQDLAIEAIKNGVNIYDPEQDKKIKIKPEYEFDQSGSIVFTQKDVQLHIATLMSRKVIFAERDAKTKAERRATMRLLGVEYRDEGEIEMEIMDIKRVEDINLEDGENKEYDVKAKPSGGKKPKIKKSTEANRELSELCRDVDMSANDSRDFVKSVYGKDSLGASDRPDFIEFLNLVKSAGLRWGKVKNIALKVLGASNFNMVVKDAIAENIKLIVENKARLIEDDRSMRIEFFDDDEAS